MIVHVLLYELGTDKEGIHSIELNGNTIVLMFEDKDDADRYCGLLEAQDFPVPSIELMQRDQIETFCTQSGYETRFVKKNFLPHTEEDRLLISPPQKNLDVSNWKETSSFNPEPDNTNLRDENDIDNFRKRLEDLY